MNDRLSEINARLLAEFPDESVGVYDLHWTTLKSAQQTINLVSQWLAWPVRAPKPLDRTRFPYLVVTVLGGSVGTYEPGAWFDIRPPKCQRAIDAINIETPEGYQRARLLIAEAGHVLRELVHYQVTEGGVAPASCLRVVGLDPVTNEIVV